ncbi:MAG: hypothetical protein IKY12_05260 [Clostridia bacterium]|nr:hypothetical protein [Clostridia bacterium]
MKRIISLILALMMIFGVCSVMMTASAANTITGVTISNIDVPAAGKAPDRTGSTSSPFAYSIDSIDWYDKTASRFLKDGDKFIVGHTYQVQVYVNANLTNNYQFATTSKGAPNVTASVNGKTATTGKDGGSAAFSRLVLYYEYTVERTDITTVSVNGITDPKAGGTPDYTGTTGASSYSIDSIDWYDKTASKFLKSGDKFVAGHTYQIQVYVDANVSGSYEFATTSKGAPNVTATVNGKTATTGKDGGSAVFARLVLYYEYTVEPNYITNVAVSDIDVPAVGKAPDYTGKVGNSAYEIGHLEWYDKTAKKFLKSGDKFVAGHTYELQVYLDIADFGQGYEFKTNSNNAPAVTGKINGKTVTVYKEDTTAAWARVAMRCEYALEANKILDVSVSGITVPKVDGTPDYEGVVGNSAYEIGYLEWYDKTAKKFLKDGDKFQDGHTYQLQIFLDVANLSDTEFATNSNGTPNVTAKINGTPVEAVKEDTTAAFARVALYYDFVVSSTATSTTAPDSSIGETTTIAPEDETTTVPEDETTTTTTPDKSDKNDKNDNTNDDGGLDLWVILAIAGGVVVVAAVVVVIIIVSKKKK